jgi:phage recombination protein Bet
MADAKNVATLPAPPQPKRKLLQQLADRYGVEPEIFERTVSAVAMPNPHSREELISCLIVANEHDLNPLTKEIHFMRDKTGKIQPIVGVDGWVKKLNTHPQFNGFKFAHEHDKDNKLVAVTCTIYRKDREYPTEATELMSECARLPAAGKGPNAWVMTPSRMLRHRALMQCTRYAIGFGGVMDLDEFERWQEMRDITPKAAVLPVPDIPDVPEPNANQDVLPLEINQDAPEPIPNPKAYLAHLEEEMSVATTTDVLDEIWESHTQTADGRLSREHQQAAEDLHAKHAQRLSKNTKGA